MNGVDSGNIIQRRSALSANGNAHAAMGDHFRKVTEIYCTKDAQDGI